VTRILVIENERIMARDLAEILQSLGHQIVGVASDYQEAVALASEHTPDLALIDIQIDGDRDGISLATELREDHEMALAFLTSHADHATVLKASVVRPNGYLIKPFSVESVDVLVNTAMANHSSLSTSIDTEKIATSSQSDAIVFKRRVQEDVERFIARNLDQSISIESLAVQFDLSVSEFSRRFKASFGEPPHKYLNTERIKEAKRLLRNTDWPVAEIALAVGFSNQSHFTSAFRKSSETTPSQYRRFAQS